jgi:hypothetical protein
MSPDREREALEAEQILNNTFLASLLKELESDAIERAISAPLTDHDFRAAALGEVRAIRSLTSKLSMRIAEASGKLRRVGGIA